MRRTLPLALAALAAACFSVTAVVAQDAKKGKCAVAGKEIEITDKTPSVMVNNEKLYFCCQNCPKAFAADVAKFVKTAGKCPVNKGADATVDAANRAIVNNNVYFFCCPGCPDTLKENPAKFVRELKDPVSGKSFTPKADSPRAEVKGQIYLFESPTTKAEFQKDNAKYVWAYK